MNMSSGVVTLMFTYEPSVICAPHELDDGHVVGPRIPSR